MTDRAYISEHYAIRDAIGVHLVQHLEEVSYIERPSGFGMDREKIDPSVADPTPSFMLSESMARALLEALAIHFGGVSETQTLRKDYMAERARVDRMIEHLTRSA